MAKKGMTKEEAGKAREERLWTDVNRVAAEYCQKVNEGRPEKEQKAAKKLVSSTLESFNAEHRKNQYLAWDNAPEGAVKSAIYQRFVPQCKRVSYKSENGGPLTPEFSDVMQKADLPEMAVALGMDRFAKTDWFVKLQKLAFLHATKLSRRINGDANFEYMCSDAAKEFKFTDDKTFSDANFFQALQTVFDAILMVPDESGNNTIKIHLEEDDNGVPFCKEWAVITESITHQGNKPGSVNIGSTSKMSELVADCMYVLVNPDQKFELAQ